jgi:hypothetical protein
MARVYTQTQAAAIRGISTPTYHVWLRQGRGPARQRFGRAYMITEASLQEWLAREPVVV